MNFNFSIILCVRSFLFIYFVFNSKLIAQLKLTEVAEKALALNPDLKRIQKKIDLAKGLKIQASSPFNTSFNASINKTLRYSNFTYDSVQSVQINSWNYSIGASRKLAFGTVILPSISVNNTGIIESTTKFGSNILNRGAANLRITQPLLLGIGNKYNLANLRSAEFDLAAAEYQYIFQSSSILLQTFVAYIQYIGAYQNLLIQIQNEATLTKSIADLNLLISSDALPASEIVLIEAQLFNQKAMRKFAQNNLTAVKNLLGAYMGLEEPEIEKLALPDTLFPFNEAIVKNDTGFVTKWLNDSELQRGDYLALNKNIKSAELSVYVSKKKIMPNLDLNLAANYSGVTQSIGSDQYYMPLLQNIPGMNYSFGLSFIFAGKNDLARGQQLASNSTLEILENQKKALLLNIRNQIKLSGNNFSNYLQVVGFLSESVRNYKKAYQNELRKFQAGTSTSFALVQVQNNYLSSKIQLINVLTNLNISVIEFRHQTGTLIQAQTNDSFKFDPTQIFTLPIAK